MKHKYIYVKNLLNKDMCDFVTDWLFKKMEHFPADPQSINSPAIHSNKDNVMQALLHFIKPIKVSIFYIFLQSYCRVWISIPILLIVTIYRLYTYSILEKRFKYILRGNVYTQVISHQCLRKNALRLAV